MVLRMFKTIYKKENDLVIRKEATINKNDCFIKEFEFLEHVKCFK